MTTATAAMVAMSTVSSTPVVPARGGRHRWQESFGDPRPGALGGFAAEVAATAAARQTMEPTKPVCWDARTSAFRPTVVTPWVDVNKEEAERLLQAAAAALSIRQWSMVTGATAPLQRLTSMLGEPNSK